MFERHTVRSQNLLKNDEPRQDIASAGVLGVHRRTVGSAYPLARLRPREPASVSLSRSDRKANSRIEQIYLAAARQGSLDRSPLARRLLTWTLQSRHSSAA